MLTPASGHTGFHRAANQFLWLMCPPELTEAQAAGPDEERHLPTIRDGADLDAFLWDYFGVKLPTHSCCPEHTPVREAFHNAYFAQAPVAVWKASRGFGGKSFTLALLAIVEALTLRADVNVLGGSGEQAKRVLENSVKLWAHPNAPRDFLNGDPGSQKQTLKWGNRITALMASQASVRGPHPQRLRMDEVDEMQQGILDSAMGQPMSKGWVLSQVVLSSTHQYADRCMAWALREAKEKGWPVFEWCWKCNHEDHGGWVTQAEVDRKRAILTTRMWETEVDLQEPSSEGRAIETECVEDCFRRDVQLEEPVPGGVYGHGGDWAKKRNWTVVVTIRRDVRPMRVVAVKRMQKEPWPKMAAHLDERVAIYGGTSTHDNTGIGQVVHDLLKHPSEPFDMVGRDRADLLSEYIAAIEHGELIWPRDDSNPHLSAAYGEHKYASREDVYKGTKDGSGTHHLPDTISAGALAWRAASKAEAAGVLKQPEEQDSPHLVQAPVRGRLTNYVMGGPKPADAPATGVPEATGRLPWRRPRG